MPQQTYDPSSKWMLEEHGASILYIAGARSVVSCRARKSEVVQPRKLPDGLLEARFADQSKSALVVVEVTTYPEERVVQQVQDDMRLVRQVYGVLPEALVLCLCPRGTYRVPREIRETSPLGWSEETLKWTVVELWTRPAEELLAAPGVGAVPLATLGHYDGPPELLLQRCRDRIDREGGKQRENLLAVTQVFAKLHYDKPKWLSILGGRKMIVETPFIQELMGESKREGNVEIIVHHLRARFGSIGPEIAAGLAQLKDKEKLFRLSLDAVTCTDLPSFAKRLREQLPAPPTPSSRGKRRTPKTSE